MITVGLTEAAEISGTVQRIDGPTGTVYFTDGRVVRVDPATRIRVGDREMRLADVQPGWVLALPGATVTPGVVAVPAGPSVNATGVVAQVDSRTGTVTLQDGRVLRVIPGTTLWQPVTVGSLAPGAAVFVRNAQPLDFQPSAARPFRMGTVSSIDAANSRVVLSDGTTVYVRPGSRVVSDGRTIGIGDLRVGDEVVIGLPVAAATSSTAVSALPRSALGLIEADSLYVVSPRQAP
jgi:hypothetical protein